MHTLGLGINSHWSQCAQAFFFILNGKRLTSQILLLRDSTATSFPVRHDEQAKENKNVPEMKSDMKREQNFERREKKAAQNLSKNTVLIRTTFPSLCNDGYGDDGGVGE